MSSGKTTETSHMTFVVLPKCIEVLVASRLRSATGDGGTLAESLPKVTLINECKF